MTTSPWQSVGVGVLRCTLSLAVFWLISGPSPGTLPIALGLAAVSATIAAAQLAFGAFWNRPPAALVEKLSSLAVFSAFLVAGWASAWMVVLIYAGELTASYFHVFARQRGVIMGVRASESMKIAAHHAAIVGVIAAMMVAASPEGAAAGRSAAVIALLSLATLASVVCLADGAMAIVTGRSGLRWVPEPHKGSRDEG